MVGAQLPEPVCTTRLAVDMPRNRHEPAFTGVTGLQPAWLLIISQAPRRR